MNSEQPPVIRFQRDVGEGPPWWCWLKPLAIEPAKSNTPRQALFLSSSAMLSLAQFMLFLKNQTHYRTLQITSSARTLQGMILSACRADEYEDAARRGPRSSRAYALSAIYRFVSLT